MNVDGRHILEKVQSDFMSYVDAKVIAPKVRMKNIISEIVATRITNSESSDGAKQVLFEHLRDQATLEGLRDFCSIMKESEGYQLMQKFGEELQARLEEVIPRPGSIQVSSAASSGVGMEGNTEQQHTLSRVQRKRPPEDHAVGEWKRQKDSDSADLKAVVHPAYNVEEIDRDCLEKAIKTVMKDKKLNKLKLKKALYRHTYIAVERILEANAQHFRHMVRIAELATEDKEVAKAVTTTCTVVQLLDKLCIKTKWKDAKLLREIVHCLPEEPRTLAKSLLKRYEGYLDVYDNIVPAQDSLLKQLAVPDVTKPQVPVEVKVSKCLAEFMNKDCKDIVNLLLHNSYNIPRIKIMATDVKTGCTTVVFLIDKAFMGNIIQYSATARSLWAYQELSVTRVRVGAFELNVVQLLTLHFKEALRSGLTGGMDFVGATKALPYQVYALVDPDISEKMIIRTVYRKVAEPCPEQEKSVSDSTADEEVEPIMEQISQTSLVIRLQEALEAVNLEGNFGVQGKPEEGAKYVTYSRLYSELEGGISLYLRSQAVKDIKVQINSWLIEQEIELAQLETQHINQTTLDSIRRLLRKLEDYLHTIQTMVRQTDTLLDDIRELPPGRPELMGIFELAVVAAEPVFESGRQPSVQDVKEETDELTRRYEELRKRVSRSYNRMQRLLDAESRLMDDKRRLVDYTGRLYSQRWEGSQQMETAAVELDSIFKWLIATILATVGFGVTGVVAGAVALGIATAGVGLLVAGALGGAAVAGGGAVLVTLFRTKMKESKSMTAANKWILEKDRPVCHDLLNIIDSFETHLNEMLAKFPDEKAMDTHFKQNGIDVEKLQECFNELLEVGRRWRHYGFGSHSEAGIKRAEEVVRTYLNKNEYDQEYLNAVTLFLDLEKIGAISYDVAYLKRAKPPIRELLRIIADGLLKDAAPAARLAEQPWRIRDQQSVVLAY